MLRYWATHPEAKVVISERLKGYFVSGEARSLLSKALKGRTKSDSTKAKMSSSQKLRMANPLNNPQYGKHLTEECKAKISKSSASRLHTEETKHKISDAAKLSWQNPEYRDRCIRATIAASHTRPSEPERVVLNLLNEHYPTEWEYVGDGSFILAGKNPDFVNVNGRKQIIEVFGDFWHKGEDPEDRIEIFRHYGYDTLVIWERELKNLDAVLVKVNSFASSCKDSLVHKRGEKN